MTAHKPKTLGLIGGIGPESTVEYYRLLVEGYQQKWDGAYPSIIINSVDLSRLLRWMAENQLDKVVDYLEIEVERLQKAGADFGALASNTPHIVFDELQRRTTLPLISIVVSVCDKVKELGLHRVALFGTRYTMQADFYRKVFHGSGVDLIVPDAEKQNFIHEKYLGELLKNVFSSETRTQILEIAEQLKEDEAIEAVILGGTELPLLLRAPSHNGIQLLDTTRIHVERLLAEFLS